MTPWHIDGSFYPRVPLLFPEHIRYLALRQVTLTGSAFRITHLAGCKDILIDGIRTLNNLRPASCENILISGCTLTSTSAAIKFGTENEAPFRNITVENCAAAPTGS